MVKHPKPHFVKHQGKWQACYGNQAKGSKYRMQMVIAEDVNAFVAHCKYLEALEPQAQAAARASRVLSVRKGRIDRIVTAWRRLMGNI